MPNVTANHAITYTKTNTLQDTQITEMTKNHRHVSKENLSFLSNNDRDTPKNSRLVFLNYNKSKIAQSVCEHFLFLSPWEKDVQSSSVTANSVRFSNTEVAGISSEFLPNFNQIKNQKQVKQPPMVSECKQDIVDSRTSVHRRWNAQSSSSKERNGHRLEYIEFLFRKRTRNTYQIPNRNIQ